MNRTNASVNIIDAAQLKSEMNIAVRPSNLEEFLPWACNLLLRDYTINVTKKVQVVYDLNKGKKSFKSKIDTSFDEDKDSISSIKSPDEESDKSKVLVKLSYLNNDVVHMRIEKTKHIPRELIALIAKIVGFHPYLQGITINSGLDQYSIYELSKLVPISNITDLCLDNTFVSEANYDIILKTNNHLQVLSLSRCKIGDQVVKNIAVQLHYPLPASMKLCVLNLSSNRLTDRSCKYMAEALKSNRKLTYLNMAGNTITTKGGNAILEVLLPFPLTAGESLAFKRRYLQYLKIKQSVIERYMSDLKMASEKMKVKSSKSPTGNTTDRINYEKASEMAQKFCGEFVDPMTDCTNIGGVRYCNGNNTLTYLNLSYNRMYYPFLKLLLKVLQYQYSKERNMKGLISVRLEGNPLPIYCEEYSLLDWYFDMGMAKNNALTKKRGTAISPGKKLITI